MGQAIPRQHPAVVLRSHFNRLRALLAVAMVAVVGLTVAVVILATDSDQVGSTSAARPIESINYRDFDVPPGREWLLPKWTPDRALSDSQPKVVTGSRYDGGPEEGTADVTAAQPRVTQQQAFPGLASEANSAEADKPSSCACGGARREVQAASQAGTKDYSMNAATGDYAAPSEPKAGARPDGGPEEGSHLR